MRNGWWIATALIAVVVGGCEKSSSPSPSAGNERITIGIVAKSQTNKVFQAAHAGTKDAARDLSQKLGKDIVVDIRTPTDEDPQAQAEAIGALVRSGAKGIAVSCSDGATLRQPINDAVEKGVVVMCFDSDSKDSKRLCYYGTDDQQCGEMVMRELAKAMNDQGTIAILAGNQSAPNLQQRVKAVRDELAKHPKMKELNDGHGVFYNEEKPEKAAEVMVSAQNANRGIQGWALVGGWPLFAADALPWKGDAIKCVSVDALPDELPYLKSGQVQMLLAQDCYGWGEKSVQILVDKIVNHKDPAMDRVIAPITPVTNANAEEWAHKWDKWLQK